MKNGLIFFKTFNSRVYEFYLTLVSFNNYLSLNIMPNTTYRIFHINRKTFNQMANHFTFKGSMMPTAESRQIS